ncbi:MAG: hypothetical protein C0459_08970 [Chitinophaga sp.]|nr:hypothetical protein [Chitinophaga sp.]
MLLSINCKVAKKRSMILNGERVEGNINNDTIYNGLIKFYNLENNSLISECNYVNGILEGERKDYYKNGVVSTILNYSQGKSNGYVSTYDYNGNIKTKAFYYYGIQVGGITDYRENKVQNYKFYSLDRDLLVNINYDSIKTKEITDLQKGYFFYRKSKASSVFLEGEIPIGDEYFIYTPNPPNYNFRYSIVLLDKNSKITDTLEDFDMTKPWSRFQMDNDLIASDNKVAIKLTMNDLVSQEKINMLKFLKQ